MALVKSPGLAPPSAAPNLLDAWLEERRESARREWLGRVQNVGFASLAVLLIAAAGMWRAAAAGEHRAAAGQAARAEQALASLGGVAAIEGPVAFASALQDSRRKTRELSNRFALVSQSVPADLAVRRLRLLEDVNGVRLSVEGETRTYAALAGLVDRMNAIPGNPTVRVSSALRADEFGPDGTVFQLESLARMEAAR